MSNIKGKIAIAFDPSFISKAEKKTPEVGYFWSGCAGKAKWGLEFWSLKGTPHFIYLDFKPLIYRAMKH